MHISILICLFGFALTALFKNGVSNKDYFERVGGFSANHGGYPTLRCSKEEVLNVAGICTSPVISRKIYIYNAPPQPVVQVPTSIMPPPKFQYNFVFVNAPKTPDSKKPIVVPPPYQKNLIYVLNRVKPFEKQRVIEAPVGPQPPPEVYYIRYNDGDNPLLPGGISLQESISSGQVSEGRVIESQTTLPQKVNPIQPLTLGHIKAGQTITELPLGPKLLPEVEVALPLSPTSDALPLSPTSDALPLSPTSDALPLSPTSDALPLSPTLDLFPEQLNGIESESEKEESRSEERIDYGAAPAPIAVFPPGYSL